MSAMHREPHPQRHDADTACGGSTGHPSPLAITVVPRLTMANHVITWATIVALALSLSGCDRAVQPCEPNDALCDLSDSDGDGVADDHDDFPSQPECSVRDDDNCMGCGEGCDAPLVCDGVGACTEFLFLEDGGYVVAHSSVAVIQQVSFSSVEEGGTAIGFDLDGVVSDDGDEESCGHGDFTDPDGRVGIDNQFAELWEVIETLVGEAVQALLLNAINDGRFLLLIELTGVDDLHNDDDVTLTLLRGAADPLVGATGLLMSDQSYYVDPDYPISVVEGVQIVDGWVEAGPVTFSVPIEIFEADFLIPIEGGRLRFEIQSDGSFSGVLGGAMHVQNALDKLYTTNAKAEAELVTPFFLETADMEHDGDACTYLSAAFGFQATSAFLVRYAGESAE